MHGLVLWPVPSARAVLSSSAVLLTEAPSTGCPPLASSSPAASRRTASATTATRSSVGPGTQTAFSRRRSGSAGPSGVYSVPFRTQHPATPSWAERPTQTGMDKSSSATPISRAPRPTRSSGRSPRAWSISAARSPDDRVWRKSCLETGGWSSATRPAPRASLRARSGLTDDRS